MKRKILVSVLVTIVAWSMCDVSDACAMLEDLPSDEEYIALGVAVAVVVTVIIVLIVKSGGGEKPEEENKEDINVSQIEPGAEVQLRIDPVFTLQKNAVGAGLSFSF